MDFPAGDWTIVAKLPRDGGGRASVDALGVGGRRGDEALVFESVEAKDFVQLEGVKGGTVLAGRRCCLRRYRRKVGQVGMDLLEEARGDRQLVLGLQLVWSWNCCHILR